MVKRLFSGREYHKNDPAVVVDYNTADPVVRWDSYENFNQRYQDSLEGNNSATFKSCRAISAHTPNKEQKNTTLF